MTCGDRNGTDSTWSPHFTLSIKTPPASSKRMESRVGTRGAAPLLGAQGENRVDLGGPTCGQVASEQRNQCEKQGHPNKGVRVDWADAIEEASHKPRNDQGASDPDGHAGSGQQQTPAYDKHQDVASGGAKRDPYSEFLRPPADSIGQDGIDTHGGKEQGNEAKDQQEARCHALREEHHS